MTTLTVGPNGQYQTISAAVSFADNDTNLNNAYDIRVAPGTYTNDFPEVTRPMTIEVDPNVSGPVLLLPTVPLPNQKGIILTTSSLTVRGLTFQGAAISDALGGNGAGIRDLNVDDGGPPASLIVENSTFLDNQEGILTGYDARENIQIINSTFKNNGNPPPHPFQHALYVNEAASLTVTGSLFGGQLIGHDIKSRAHTTTITNNRIYDGAADAADGINAGSTSYGIDVPNGGVVTISGNLIIQGPSSQNSTIVEYGAEGLVYDNNNLTVSDNTFISSGLSHATGIYDAPGIAVHLHNNIFQGIETPVDPPSAADFAAGAPPPVDTPPVVMPVSANITARTGQSLAASALFTVSDPDGDAIAQYDFWDTGGGGGHFLVNGVTQPINGDIIVSASQLAQTTYRPGSGTDTLWVKAYDGAQWSGWSQAFTVTAHIAAVNTPPMVTPVSANITASTGQSLAASALFTVSDPDGDAIAQYDFWDTGGGGGHFLVNGVTQPINGDIIVPTSQLAQATYQPGSGTDTIWVRANDGTQWSGWSQAFAVTAHIAAVNTPPVVTPVSANLTASTGQSLAASALFTVSDPDGDAIAQYDFWDTGGGGGHFLVNGVTQPIDGDIIVSASQLAQTTYQPGSGTDTLWVKAYDGAQWSTWSAAFAVTAEATSNSLLASSATGDQAMLLAHSP